jgi:hypothetical protein
LSIYLYAYSLRTAESAFTKFHIGTFC